MIVIVTSCHLYMQVCISTMTIFIIFYICRDDKITKIVITTSTVRHMTSLQKSKRQTTTHRQNRAEDLLFPHSVIFFYISQNGRFYKITRSQIRRSLTACEDSGTFFFGGFDVLEYLCKVEFYVQTWHIVVMTWSWCHLMLCHEDMINVMMTWTGVMVIFPFCHGKFREVSRKMSGKFTFSCWVLLTRGPIEGSSFENGSPMWIYNS